MANISDDVTDPETGAVLTVVWTGGKYSPPLCDARGYESVGLRQPSPMPAKAINGRRLAVGVMPSAQALT